MAAAIGAATIALTACGNATAPVRSVAGGDQAATAVVGSTGGSAGSTGSTGTAAPSGTGGSSPNRATPTGAGPSSAGEALTVDGRSIIVAPGMTFPPGSKVSLAMTAEDGGSVTLEAPDGPTIASYFRSALPAAGYRIDTDAGSLIAFSGHGWSGSVATSMGPGSSLISYGPQDSSAPADPTPQVDDTVLTARDLNLTNVPFFIRYPAGTTVTVTSDSAAGANYVLHGHTGQEFLDFFRAELPRRHFDITGDHANGGVTTLTFVDGGDSDEFTSVLTVSPTEVRLQHTK